MESPAILIVQIGLRILGAVVCSNKATSLNRNAAGWGVFGFIMPIVAMIWVQFMKPHVDWERSNDNTEKYS